MNQKTNNRMQMLTAMAILLQQYLSGGLSSGKQQV